MNSNISIFWQYTVRPQCRDEFESVYGAQGDWARLFANSPAYLGTSLMRQSDNALVYITVERWNSEADFVQFKQTHAGAYAALDARCEAFTAAEKFMGLYNALD